jgi:hypothetical protein
VSSGAAHGERPMSVMGQKQTSDERLLMSALPPKADIVEFEPVAMRRKGRGGLPQIPTVSLELPVDGTGESWFAVSLPPPSASAKHNITSGRRQPQRRRVLQKLTVNVTSHARTCFHA